MNFDVDLALMFSDFGETSTVTTKQGVQRTAIVLLDADYDSESTGGFTTNMRTITATSTHASDLMVGETLACNGTTYDIISVEKKPDGLLTATLRAKA